MKRFFIISIWALFLLILMYCIINFNLVKYGFSQLKGQLSIIYNAKPVEDFLNDDAFPVQYKKKLRMIEAVRQYAMDSLGLKNSKNYTTLYDQKNQPALWVLTACPPFSMEPYEWKFPFLGKVSYKGFFKKENGLKEEKQLRDRFYDTEFNPAGGWSTLGFFKDPILSNMLKRSEGRLAELIIHELTHATLYLPGSVEFNENFATFIGEQGAERFLLSHFGKDSKELNDYIYFRKDEAAYGKYMVTACSRLDSLYKTMNNESFGEKLRKKHQLIIEILSGINNLPLHYPERYRHSFEKNSIPGNAFFLSYKTYRSSQDQLKSELMEYNNDLRRYIRSMAGK